MQVRGSLSRILGQSPRPVGLQYGPGPTPSDACTVDHTSLLPRCVSQHQHFILTSKHLYVLSISLAIATRNSSYSNGQCVWPRSDQSCNFALCIGKSLSALDLARNRHKFQHRLTHRLQTLHQLSAPSFLHSRAFRGGLNLSAVMALWSLWSW